MWGSIFSIIAGVAGALSKLAGWMKTNQDQAAGEQIQRAADLTASQAEASDAQKTVAIVDTQSRDQLIDELRGPTGTGQ